MRDSIRRWSLIGVLLGVVSWGSSASAQGSQPTPAPSSSSSSSTIEAARTHYQRGVQLFGEGDYNLALIEFLRSNELLPSWRINYNIGLVQYQLAHYAAALRSLEEYLREGGESVSAERRASVLGDIASLKVRTARLSVFVNVPGADVRLADTTLGTAPIQGQLIDAGFREVTVSKRGFVTVRQALTLAGGEEKRLDIALKEEEVVTPNRPVESRSVAPLWIAWGVTGALIAGTVGVGIASYNSDSELDGLKSQRNVTRAELDSKNTQVRTLTVTRNILGGVSILSIGIATYLTIRELRLRGKNQASLAPPTMGALSNVWIGPSSFGVFKQF